MRRYVYHYHIVIGDDNGPYGSIDGIAQMVKPIENMEDYDLLKTEAHKQNGTGNAPISLVITSLSFLGRETEDLQND